MDFEAALRARLTGDSAVAALVGQRVAWEDRPQGTALPAITIDYVLDPRDQHMGGFQSLRRALVQIDVWATTFASKKAVKEAVIAALAPEVTANGVIFQGATNISAVSRNERTETQFVFRDQIDMTFYYAIASTSYTAQAVHLDGSTYLTNDSLVAAVSPYWSFVIWFKTTVDKRSPTFFVGDPTGIVVPYVPMYFGSFDIEILALPSSSNVELRVNPLYNDGNWHCIMFSCDMRPAVRYPYAVYVDDVRITDVTDETQTGGDGDNVLGNGIPVWIGYDNQGSDGFYEGDMADYRMFYGVSLLDGTGDIPLATRRLFIDASGKPVDPAIATAALGEATIQLTDGAASFATNQGTGGAFTLTGTLTDATTSPSD